MYIGKLNNPTDMFHVFYGAFQGAICVFCRNSARRADGDIKWLIVYVLLSRVRSLSSLRSVGLSAKIRAIIEKGPPEMIAESFEKLFSRKIEGIKKAAEAAKAALRWQ